MDAIAVTLASSGRYICVAPHGTSLTDEQAAELASLAVHPIVATDADPAGRIAAERDYWMLSCYRLDPATHRFPKAPIQPTFSHSETTALTEALTAAQPLAERLFDERLNNLPPTQALREAARGPKQEVGWIAVARPPRPPPPRPDG